ncbi:hypothetical protein [Mastigocoleus testarum]|uniref:Effector-associated domain-containing protein n=1 Tax=Mastigocoleus testarum BC008 TaxID=371196 RepID=A0A0V7ZZ75_9CYAN|nr:hypothetical protein [Mastigocoleus testarum]KST69860.1 hypothetical protein BC008_05335 [Mastigocoleus testarum BC008]
MESIELEELLKNIQELQSIMIGVPTRKYSIQDKDEEYKELYQEIESQIEELQYEGLPIENPNSFHSLWDWYEHYTSNKLRKSARKGGYIHDIYQDICNQVEITLYQCYLEKIPSEDLELNLEFSRIEELKSKIEKLQNIMIDVATLGDAPYYIDDKEQEYSQIYRELSWHIVIIQSRGVAVLNPNKFRSLWQWYDFYSEQLENTKNARIDYIKNIYLEILKPFDRVLKKYRNKSNSTEEFIQYLKSRFQQVNSILPTTTVLTADASNSSLSSSLQVSNKSNSESLAQKFDQVPSTNPIIPTQSVNNLSYEQEDYNSNWTYEDVMNPEVFLEQKDIPSLIIALNKFALKVSVANDRYNALETANIDDAFLSNIRFDTGSNIFAQSLVAAFKNYQVSNQNLSYHPLINFLKSLTDLALIYGFRDQDIELFNRLVEKGQENFEALKARNSIARIESPTGWKCNRNRYINT